MNNQNLELIKNMPPMEAIQILDGFLKEKPTEEAYLLRGQKHWALGNRREAINDYLSAIKINPHSKANLLLEQANTILGYYNKDLLNP